MIIEVIEIITGKIEGVETPKKARIKLKECPLCGGTPGIVHEECGMHMVICENCNASGPVKFNSVDAANAWNVRPDAKEKFAVKLTEEDLKLFVSDVKTQVAEDIKKSLVVLEKYNCGSDEYIKKDGVVRILNGFIRRRAKCEK